MTVLSRYSAKRVVEGLRLNDRIRVDVLRVIDRAGDDGRIRVSDVIDDLFPYVTTGSANNGITKIVKAVNAAAERYGVPVRLEKTANKRAGASDRWLWFEGPEPAPALARTSEIDNIPANELISGQRGITPGERPRILLLTFNEHETRAVVRQFCGDQPVPTTTLHEITYNNLGVHGGAHIYHRVSRQGVSEAQLSTAEGIEALSPKAVIGVGIAFGLSERSQRIGDVLVSTAVRDYELKKVKSGGQVIPRGMTPPASRPLVERFNHLAQHVRADGADGWPRICPGIVLSGNSLVDDLDYRDSLVKLAGTEVIGGEMEAVGIQKCADAKGVHWIIVKAICDWGDGNKSNLRKEADQQLAATNAARVVWEALNNPLYPTGGMAMSPDPDPTTPSFRALEDVGDRFQFNRGRATTLHKNAVEAASADEGDEVLATLHSWVRQPDAPPIFALLGEYGMGKTVSCQRFARELRAARETDPSVPLALYFDLRDVTGLINGVPTLDQIVEEVMARSWPREGATHTAADFHRWISTGTVVIFDGLDEVLVKLTEGDGQVFTRTLLSIVQPGAASPKVVVSCRTQYFRTLRDQQNHFTGQERGNARADLFRAMVLLPFSEDQIRRYLAAALPDEDPDRLLAMVRSIHDLGELTERPYTLSLVAQYIPDLEQDRLAGRPVYGVALYRRTVENWLDRDEGKHQIRRSDKLPLAAHLAAHLWKSRQPALPARDIELWFQTWLDSEPGLRSRYAGIHPDRLEEDLRTATFLARSDGPNDSTFRFCHTSMQEFFLAVYLRDALKVNEPSGWALPRPSDETLDFLGQLLAEADDPKLVATLGEWRHQYREQVSENLFAYALRAFAHDWPIPVLRGLRLPGVDLDDLAVPAWEGRRLDLTGAVFTGATLRRAALDNVVLDRVDFSGAALNQAYFRNCSATYSLWCGVDAPGAVWRGTQLGGADFSGVNLAGASFQHCQGVPDSVDATHQVPSSAPVTKPGSAILRWHGSSQVHMIAYRPGGRQLAAFGTDGVVRLWDAETGALVSTLGHVGWAPALAYRPDGSQLATGGRDGVVRVWDAETGALVTTLGGEAGWVRLVAYRPDGGQLAVAGDDGVVRVWDAETGALVATLTGPTGSVWALAYRPDGGQLATGGDDGVVRVWDAETGALVATLTGPTGSVWALAYRPDGGQLATGGQSEDVRVWDTNTEALVTTLTTPTGTAGWVQAVAYRPDGAQIAAAGGDGVVRIWDAPTGALVVALAGPDSPWIQVDTPWVQSVAYRPDGSQFVVGGNDGVARVWGAGSGILASSLAGHAGSFQSVAYRPNGSQLVIGGGDGVVQIWDAGSGVLLTSLGGHAGSVWAVAYRPNGSQLATGGADGVVQIWDADSAALVTTLAGRLGWTEVVVYRPDGSQLATSGRGAVGIWDADTGAFVMSLTGDTGWVRAAAYRPDGSQLATGSDDGVRIWNADTGALIMTFAGSTGRVCAVAYRPDGRQLATSDHDGVVRVWDADTGTLVTKLAGHTGGINAVVYRPDGTQLATASNDGTVRIWDCQSWENALAIGVLAPDRLGVGGHVAWQPTTNTVLHAEGDAWRALRWEEPRPEAFPLVHHLEDVVEPVPAPD